MSGSDSDLPDLVDSDDDCTTTLKPPEKTNADFADIWLKKTEIFLEKQENYIRIFALGPFLFALNNLVPKPWMSSLRNTRLLLNDKREKDLSGLDWEEWSLVDLVENVISVMMKKLRKKHYLIGILNTVDKIDNSDVIDVGMAIEKSSQIIEVKKLWNKALKSPICRKREQETKFAVLYVGKIYHLLVIGLGRDCKSLADEMKKSLRQKGVDPVRLKDAGNKEYQSGKFETASDYYARAARADPLNHIYFGNRAQVNNKLKKYCEALADGRRAILLKPDWTKGHYRYAQAFYELDKIDMAITVNRKGQEICRNTKSMSDNNFKDLVQQGENYRKERDDKLKKEKIKKAVESVISDERNLPDALKGQKRIINLSEAFKVLDDEPNADLDVPELVESSDSSDEDIPDLEDDDEDEQMTKRKVPVSGKNKKNGKSETKPVTNNKSNTKQRETKPLVESQDKPSKKSSKSETVKQPETSKVVPPSVSTPQTTTTKNKKQNSKINKKKAVDVENPEFLDLLKTASDSYLGGVYKNAVTLYKKALDMTNDNVPLEWFGIDEQDLVTLKFACGFASVSTQMHKFILDGIDKFYEILKSNQTVQFPFPLVYYGLGKAYCSLNRYLEAISPLKTGLRMFDRVKFTVVTWPGTQCKIVEGEADTLRKLMKDMLKLCRFPPKPDSRCRYHTDTEENRTAIYFLDPDFKGFVRMFCKSRCLIEFHNNCWKMYKAKFGKFGDKIGDKDILDTLCPTPDCNDFISRIIIFRADSNSKEIESEKVYKEPKPRKPLKKLPLSNVYKIERKKERKELRKQRRREHQEEELDDLLDSEESVVPTSEKRASTDSKDSIAESGAVNNENEPDTVLEQKSAIVLSKDDEDWKLPKYKGTKKQKNTKKKKEKAPTKMVLNLEVNFSDDKDKTLLGEDEADDEDVQREPIPYVKPPRSNISAHSKNHHPVVPVEPDFQDECTATLLTFFTDMLRENGPMHVKDTVISSMLEEFPKEAKDRIDGAGGLCNFLQQSTQIAMYDGIVCLLKDASKAREIAIARKNNIGKLGKENPWKTIGKGNVETFVDHSDFPDFTQPPPSENNQLRNDKNREIVTSVEKKTIDSSVDGVNSTPSVSPKPIGTIMKNTYNSLDDFSPPKVKTLDLNSLDTIDSIDDIPLYTASKKVKKKHLDDLDDYKSVSETDSESLKDGSISDVKTDGFKSSLLDDKIDYYKASKDDKLWGDPISTISRSSSRSDLSEHSDISSELMAKAYMQPNRHSPLGNPVTSKPSWPNKDMGPSPNTTLGFGPIGSPVPSSMDKGLDSGISKPVSSNMLGQNGMTLHEEVAIATEKEIKKIDTQLVNELAEEVVDQMFFGKNVSDSQRSLTFDRVAKDIWSDFKKSSDSSSFPSVSRPNFGFPTNSGDKNVNFSRDKKSYAEQFMKSHYQQKTYTDPTGLGETFLSPFAVSSQEYPSVSSNSIWSHSLTPSGSNLGPSFPIPPFPPKPLTLPNAKVHPFGNLSIGTSIGAPATQSDFSSFSSTPYFQSSSDSSGRSSVSVSTNEQSVQVTIETRCVEVNTDPYEPYKDSLIKANEERNYFERSLQDAVTQLQEITTLLQQRDTRCKVLEQKVLTFDEERENIMRNHERHINEIATLQQAITHQKEMELEQLKIRSELEQKVAELIQIQNEDRDLKQMMKNEQIDALKNKEEFRKSFEEELERAKSAEVELLKTKLGYALQMLQRSHKEAMFYTKNLTDMVKKREGSEQQIPQRIQQALDHYRNISQKCEETIARLKSEFESQIQQIQSGKKLSELPQIFIPPPPPPLPMNFLSQEMGQGAGPVQPSGAAVSQGSVVPPGSSVPQLSALSSASITSSSMAAPSQPVSTLPQTSTVTSTVQQPKPLVPPPGLQTRPLGTPAAVSQLRQPAPLAAAQGIVPPRPTSYVRPITASLVAGVVHQPPKNSFEKLIARLQTVFPRCNRADFIRLIQELRASRGNSLSGMTLDDIVQQITELILKHEQEQNIKTSQPVTSTQESAGKASELSAPAKSLVPPPGLNPSWGFQSGGDSGISQGEVFEEEEDPCVICHEEMASQPCVTLDCKHMFHDECIRKWLREQSTCPNCRIHALLPDEFPSLK